MLYRYKLRDSVDNKGLNSVSINRVTLRRDKWFYSTKPLFHRYIGGRVDEQIAPTMEDFPEAVTPRREDVVKELEKHTKTELKDIAVSLHIDEEDFRGMKKDGLIDLIADY